MALKLGFHIDINDIPIRTFELIKVIDDEVNEKEKSDMKLRK